MIVEEAKACEQAIILAPASAKCGKALKNSQKGLKEAFAYLSAYQDIIEAQEDSELRELIPELERHLGDVAKALHLALKDPTDNRRAKMIIEIRSGVGGEEAALWVRQIARMFIRYADRRHWSVEEISSNPSKGGGLKECILSIIGPGAAILLEETGIHRIQRVSPTDSRNRVHTSAASVAVLREPNRSEFVLNLDEVEIQFYRATGNGGQNINKRETAVRAHHLPTGIVVNIQDERQQEQNKAKALQILSARVAAELEEGKKREEVATRRGQLGSGDRSQKRRTYDFPENLVVDHLRKTRTPLLSEVLNGNLDLLRID